MKAKEYWLITLVYIHGNNITYSTRFFERFPETKDLLDSNGEQGCILFMKELTKIQFDNLSKKL